MACSSVWGWLLKAAFPTIRKHLLILTGALFLFLQPLVFQLFHLLVTGLHPHLFSWVVSQFISHCCGLGDIQHYTEENWKRFFFFLFLTDSLSSFYVFLCLCWFFFCFMQMKELSALQNLNLTTQLLLKRPTSRLVKEKRQP